MTEQPKPLTDEDLARMEGCLYPEDRCVFCDSPFGSALRPPEHTPDCSWLALVAEVRRLRAMVGTPPALGKLPWDRPVINLPRPR